MSCKREKSDKVKSRCGKVGHWKKVCNSNKTTAVTYWTWENICAYVPKCLQESSLNMTISDS